MVRGILEPNDPTRGLPGVPIAFSAALLCISSPPLAAAALPRLLSALENTTEQSVVGEIVAQRLEQQLGIHVTRRPNIGGTLLAYQGLQSGEINIYPEYTGTMITEVLKEQPSNDPNQLFERA